MFSFFGKRNSEFDLSVEEFKSRLREGDVILDVRTPREYAASHLVDAINIDSQDWEFDSRVEELERGRRYYLYCRTGNRSGKAAGIMRDMGFEEAYNIGGLSDLADAGCEVTSE